MKFIPNAITRKASMLLLNTSKHSPTILFAGGVVGVIGTVVLASRATLKLEEVLNETNQTLSDISKLVDHPHYTEEDIIKDKAIVYTRAVVKIAKLYGPAVILGTASIGMLAGSHHILNRRNAAITAAYAALDRGFRTYRDRVVEDIGHEKDAKYLYGVEKEKDTITDENGKKIKVEKKLATTATTYGRLFHEGNPNWQRVPEYNLIFLRGIQQMANDRLNSKGYLLLKDVYEDLGFDPTPASCVVGWLANGKSKGDGYIDFGIFDEVSALRIYDYVTGREGELFLDFNVDGIIYDKI